MLEVTNMDNVKLYNRQAVDRLVTADRNALLDRLEGRAESYYERVGSTVEVQAVPLSVIEAERRGDG